MPNHEADHGDCGPDIHLPDHLRHLKGKLSIRKVKTDKIYGRLITSVDPVVIRPIAIRKSPHYKFIRGDHRPYMSYIDLTNRPEFLIENFRELIDNFTTYLDNGYENYYIICEEKNGRYYIEDGFHRCTILVYRGYENIPIAVIDKKRLQLKQYLYDFKEWCMALSTGGFKKVKIFLENIQLLNIIKKY